MTDENMKQALREAYERNDHARRLGSCNVPYMGGMAISKLCFILGDVQMVPDLFRAIERADTPKLKKAIEYCEQHGYLELTDEPMSR